MDAFPQFIYTADQMRFSDTLIAADDASWLAYQPLAPKKKAAKAKTKPRTRR
jgi:hypothetical protein